MHAAYRRTRSAVLTIASIVGGLCVVAALAGLLFRVTPLIVVSGSMEPGIPTGALILAHERPVEGVAVGDVVAVDRRDGHGLITHRVVSIETVDGEISLTLKGDANTLVDPSLYSPETVGACVLSIPGAGNVIAFLQTGSGMLIGGAILLAIVALGILDPQRMKSRVETVAEEDASASSLEGRSPPKAGSSSREVAVADRRTEVSTFPHPDSDKDLSTLPVRHERRLLGDQSSAACADRLVGEGRA